LRNLVRLDEAVCSPQPSDAVYATVSEDIRNGARDAGGAFSTCVLQSQLHISGSANRKEGLRTLLRR
jgi:hypothetical protein